MPANETGFFRNRKANKLPDPLKITANEIDASISKTAANPDPLPTWKNTKARHTHKTARKPKIVTPT
jgi:hypothetical protein